MSACKDVLNDVWTNFTTYGHYHDTHFTDLFAHGAWLDFTSIPVLNNNNSKNNITITSYMLGGIVYDHLVAGIVNAYWRIQRTWIMGYPMTQDECMHL